MSTREDERRCGSASTAAIVSPCGAFAGRIPRFWLKIMMSSMPRKKLGVEYATIAIVDSV